MSDAVLPLRPDKELHKLQFHTDYCRCDPFGTCTHGLCKTCNSSYSDCSEDRTTNATRDGG